MRHSEDRILFVISDNYKSERLGIQILSTIAQEEGFERDLLIINSIPVKGGLKKALDYQPQIIAYSGMTFEHIALQNLNKMLKQQGLKFISIFGGHHYTFNPEEIIKDDNIDVLCRGEGEVTFRTFIQAVRDGKSYNHIEKMWVRNGNEVINNPVGTLIHDLDNVPFADRHLIPFGDLSSDHLQGKSLMLMFGRGCPHKCSYCFNANYNEIFRGSPIYRNRSANNVISELKQIVNEFVLDLIIFMDDCFSYLPRNVIEDFCQKYKKEIKKPFVAQFRAETVKEDIIMMLKDAGLFLSPIGVECGNEYVHHKTLKRGRINRNRIIKSFEILKKHGIRTWSLNLMALPVENPFEVDMETIKLNIQIRPFWAQFNILVPIPGTPIWNYLIENGYIDEDTFLRSNKLPSGFTKTQLYFKDPKIVNKVNNLHKFAGIVVKFPFLLSLVKIIICLPYNKIYQYIFFLWYGYWKSIGSFNAKFSIKLLVNGMRAIRKYLLKY